MGFYSTLDLLISLSEIKTMNTEIINRLIGATVLFKKEKYILTMCYKNLKHDFLADNVFVRMNSRNYRRLSEVELPSSFHAELDRVMDKGTRNIDGYQINDTDVYITIPVEQ